MLISVCKRILEWRYHKLYFSFVAQVAEVKLARFVEEVVVPPTMIDTIVDGEVGLLVDLPYDFNMVFVHQYGHYQSHQAFECSLRLVTKFVLGLRVHCKIILSTATGLSLQLQLRKWNKN